MFKTLGSILTVGLLLVLMSIVISPAFGELTHYANPQNGDSIVITYTSESAGWDNGGPFLATLSGSTSNVWKTFCVEADGGDEVFTPGATYQVWSTDPNTASASGNYVTDAAKWLYYQSLHDPGQLEGYAADITHDSELQEAIWLGVLKADGNPLDMPHDATADAWFAVATAKTAGGIWAEADLVRVINPADVNYSSGPQAQSQLYETVQFVPEPATLILLGTCLFVFLAYARPWRNRTL